MVPLDGIYLAKDERLSTFVIQRDLSEDPSHDIKATRQLNEGLKN